MKQKFVIPAKAGIQTHSNPVENLDSRLRRNDKWKIFNWFLIILISIPLIVSAQAPDPQSVNTVLTNFLALLTIVIKILISSAFVVFGWGVVKFIFTANDPKKIEQAKYIMLLGIIGIFVLASMGGIIIFIKTYFGIPDNSPIQPPTFTTFLIQNAYVS